MKNLASVVFGQSCASKNIDDNSALLVIIMTQVQLAVKLDQLIEAGPNIFLKTSPETIDFTKQVSFDLIFKTKTFDFEIEVNDDNFLEVLALVRTAIFENSKLFIIAWNIKPLFTYVLFKTNDYLEAPGKLLDLKLAECFIGIRDRSPGTFAEMLGRLKAVINDSSWNKLKKIFQKIYLPLTTKVIPKIEIEGVFNTGQKRLVFPFYEIEGQSGGRLACQMAYDSCFNPHSLSDEEKAKLQPKVHGATFLCFDYHFHEVCVLAWLSRDEWLQELVSGDGDFYRKLYKEITGASCETDAKRSFCKDYLFLPVIYGQSAKTLADRAKINISVAEKLIYKLHNIFPTLFNWLEDYKLENGVCTDFVGRKRKFSEGEEYKYRNFLVQSPGAIFALDKLVELHNSLGDYSNIVAHIHDGYVIRCAETNSEMVCMMASKILESESDLFPGLKLRSNCKISKTLS